MDVYKRNIALALTTDHARALALISAHGPHRHAIVALLGRGELAILRGGYAKLLAALLPKRSS